MAIRYGNSIAVIASAKGFIIYKKPLKLLLKSFHYLLFLKNTTLVFKLYSKEGRNFKGYQSLSIPSFSIRLSPRGKVPYGYQGLRKLGTEKDNIEEIISMEEPMLRIFSKGRMKSPWIFHLNTGSCNGCDIEIVAALTPRYDPERLGCVLVGSPRHADVLLLTGPLTHKMFSRVVRVYEQTPEPKAVVAVGACAVSGGPFLGSYTVEGPLDRIIPVDVYVAGCPPRPEAIVRGIVDALKKKFR